MCYELWKSIFTGQLPAATLLCTGLWKLSDCNLNPVISSCGELDDCMDDTAICAAVTGIFISADCVTLRHHCLSPVDSDLFSRSFHSFKNAIFSTFCSIMPYPQSFSLFLSTILPLCWVTACFFWSVIGEFNLAVQCGMCSLPFSSCMLRRVRCLIISCMGQYLLYCLKLSLSLFTYSRNWLI